MVPPSLDDFAEILFDEETIQKRVEGMAGEILKDYWGKELILLGVLKGAENFFMDLRKELQKQAMGSYRNILDVLPDMVIIRLYPDPQNPEKKLETILDLDPNIQYQGKNVLVVEDIVDRGLTMKHLLDFLEEKNPSSVKVCALLSKKETRQVEIKIDYLGFEVENKFVVGYGLDFNQKYRDVPFIGVLKEEIYNPQNFPPGLGPVAKGTQSSM